MSFSERPNKRLRFLSSTADDEALRHLREGSKQRLRSSFEAIYDKYSHDFSLVGDEIDAVTGELVVDNGHLASMRHEADIGSKLRSSGYRRAAVRTEIRDDVSEDELCSDTSAQVTPSSRKSERPGAQEFEAGISQPALSPPNLQPTPTVETSGLLSLAQDDTTALTSQQQETPNPLTQNARVDFTDPSALEKFKTDIANQVATQLATMLSGGGTNSSPLAALLKRPGGTQQDLALPLPSPRVKSRSPSLGPSRPRRETRSIVHPDSPQPHFASLEEGPTSPSRPRSRARSTSGDYSSLASDGWTMQELKLLVKYKVWDRPTSFVASMIPGKTMADVEYKWSCLSDDDRTKIRMLDYYEHRQRERSSSSSEEIMPADRRDSIAIRPRRPYRRRSMPAAAVQRPSASSPSMLESYHHDQDGRRTDRWSLEETLRIVDLRDSQGMSFRQMLGQFPGRNYNGLNARYHYAHKYGIPGHSVGPKRKRYSRWYAKSGAIDDQRVRRASSELLTHHTPQNVTSQRTATRSEVRETPEASADASACGIAAMTPDDTPESSHSRTRRLSTRSNPIDMPFGLRERESRPRYRFKRTYRKRRSSAGTKPTSELPETSQMPSDKDTESTSSHSERDPLRHWREPPVPTSRFPVPPSIPSGDALPEAENGAPAAPASPETTQPLNIASPAAQSHTSPSYSRNFLTELKAVSQLGAVVPATTFDGDVVAESSGVAVDNPDEESADELALES